MIFVAPCGGTWIEEGYQYPSRVAAQAYCGHTKKLICFVSFEETVSRCVRSCDSPRFVFFHFAASFVDSLDVSNEACMSPLPPYISYMLCCDFWWFMETQGVLVSL